jgi:hypothetical protein
LVCERCFCGESGGKAGGSGGKRARWKGKRGAIAKGRPSHEEGSRRARALEEQQDEEGEGGVEALAGLFGEGIDDGM